jgi:hypothetical protein
VDFDFFGYADQHKRVLSLYERSKLSKFR